MEIQNLEFKKGKVSGHGSDAIGEFEIIDGTITSDGRIGFTK